MTTPTDFYTQAPSLLPQGLQSLISGGAQGPSVPDASNPMLPRASAWGQGNPFGGQQTPMPMNWNQAAQQAAPLYQGSYAPPQMPQMPMQMPVMNQAPVSMTGTQFGSNIMPAYGTFSRAMVR